MKDGELVGHVAMVGSTGPDDVAEDVCVLLNVWGAAVEQLRWASLGA